jgi:putative tricarboxylic transport membrane protein
MKASPYTGKMLKAVMLTALAFFVFSAGVQAAEFKPTKPINVVVPYAPGGGSDVFARAIDSAIKSEKLCPERFLVVNQPGGSGTIGQTSVAQQPGNDHLLLTFISGQITGPLIVGKGAASYKDLTMIANLALDEQLIVVKADSPYKTIQDVVAAAKKQTLTIAGTGTGQEDHMCNRLFEKAAGIKLRYIPFNSGGECITALLGGHVNMIWANPSEFVPQYEAKMVRPLAVAKDERLDMLKDVPTFKEKGYDFDFFFFRGIAAPPKVSAEAVAYYEALMKKMSETPAWKDKYLKQNMLSPYFKGSKDFSQFVAKNEKVFSEILRELEILK